MLKTVRINAQIIENKEYSCWLAAVGRQARGTPGTAGADEARQWQRDRGVARDSVQHHHPRCLSHPLHQRLFNHLLRPPAATPARQSASPCTGLIEPTCTVHVVT